MRIDGRGLGKSAAEGVMNLPRLGSWSSWTDRVGRSRSPRLAHDEDAQIELGQTIIIVRPAKLRCVLGEETLVACGSSRGGTSIVAYVLLRLGHHLGESVGLYNHEDQEILAAMQNRRQMTSIIESRNRSLKRWGFKLPEAIHHID
jgi:hypothetical protein